MNGISDQCLAEVDLGKSLVPFCPRRKMYKTENRKLPRPSQQSRGSVCALI